MLHLCFVLLLTSFAFADETLHFKATYQVPTERIEDAPAALYELQEYTALKRDQANPTKAKLSYVLPARMTGVEQKVEMELMIEELPRRVFKGPLAVALCEGVWKEMKCQVRFTGLKFNYKNLSKVLRSEELSTMEIETKINAIKRFAGEPIGVSKVIQ